MDKNNVKNVTDELKMKAPREEGNEEMSNEKTPAEKHAEEISATVMALADTLVKILSNDEDLAAMVSAPATSCEEEMEEDAFEEDEDMIPAPDVLVFDTDGNLNATDIDECFAILPWYGDSNILIPVPEMKGLYLTCKSEDLMIVNEKLYLDGEAVVMRMDDEKNPISVTVYDALDFLDLMDKNMHTLSNKRTGKIKMAFCLEERKKSKGEHISYAGRSRKSYC